jgi:hypothetical protein
MIIRRRCQIREFLVFEIPFRHDAEVKLPDIEIRSFRQARRADRDMVTAHIGERRTAILRRHDKIRHWVSSLSLLRSSQDESYMPVEHPERSNEQRMRDAA